MKQRILVVEDNLMNRMILQKILSDEYEIIQAENGRKALDIIQKEYKTLDAVIMDLRMPELGGEELLRILFEDGKYMGLPILVATAEYDQGVESRCLRIGAWDFVSKPYNAGVIRIRLKNIIARSQMQLMREVKELSEKDRLTGIYNRWYFMDQTWRMIADHPDEEFVLIRMDIDNFRLYNSSFGSNAGDELLKKIAYEIKINAEETETYGRMESDVFCLCKIYRHDECIQYLNKAEMEIQSLCPAYKLSITFGLYVVHDLLNDMEKMYSYVTEAARASKRIVNSVYMFYDEKLSKEEQRIQRITNEMGKAIEEEQFQVYFQPKYALLSESVAGAEALVRWIHPVYGKVSPGDFIPIFEKNGLIVQLDYYMWEHVCMILKKWIDEGRKIYPISVNISRISMFNPNIVTQIVNLTETYRIPKEFLNLEITESAYMSNPELMKDIISELRAQGFVILMDDFGSGYSSLNTLKDIEVDILKIDMKFLPSGGTNVKSEKILASMIRMARWIGMPVVVEGVETFEQKEFLNSLGCGYVQGYYYAKPMTAENYEKLIDKQSKTMAQKSVMGEELNEAVNIWSGNQEKMKYLGEMDTPFAIFGFGNKNISVFEENDSYKKHFGENVSLENMLNSREYYKLIDAVEQVIYTKKKTECTCTYILESGDMESYRIKLMYIGTMSGKELASAIFTNITDELRLERQLRTTFGSFNDDEITESLLVIDDSEVSREIINSIFEDEYNILTAGDGMEGLELLSANSDSIAVILLDMRMPKLDGEGFLIYKNQMPEVAKTPVVVISADDDINVQINMLENGVNDYVTKPFVSAVVKQRVRNVIEYNTRFRELMKEYNHIDE